MANYSTIAEVGYRVHMTFSASTRPSSTEVADFMNQATSIINAEAMSSSNMTDTFGVLKVIEIRLVRSMIINVLAIANPEKYYDEPVELTPDEKRTIHMAQRRWAAHSFQVGD